MRYLLDIVIHEGSIFDKPESNQPIWALVKVDGLSTPFHTRRVDPTPNPIFNTQTRLILEIEDLAHAYMYINMCTYTNDGSQVTSLMVSKVGLKSFPVGRPRKFQIPLMLTSNTAIKGGSLTLTATISAFLVQYSSASMQPGYSIGYGYGSGQMPQTYSSSPF